MAASSEQIVLPQYTQDSSFPFKFLKWITIVRSFTTIVILATVYITGPMQDLFTMIMISVMPTLCVVSAVMTIWKPGKCWMITVAVLNSVAALGESPGALFILSRHGLRLSDIIENNGIDVVIVVEFQGIAMLLEIIAIVLTLVTVYKAVCCSTTKISVITAVYVSEDNDAANNGVTA